ncbi:MAG: glutamate--tRNA ligase [Acidobacteria bacterium]|nr:MAG: glutamate--tRNA ligase [Acidobacteriota bacterium]
MPAAGDPIANPSVPPGPAPARDRITRPTLAGSGRREAPVHRPPRVRFAPAPTGRLHLGGARTALVNALFARARGGTLVLRIEDTDPERNLPGADEAIEEDLLWLGIVPDEGPTEGGAFGPYRQSERGPVYGGAFEALRAAGRLYPCWCGPEARAESGCPGGCGGLAEGERERRLAREPAVPAWRFRLGEQREVADLLRGRVSFRGAPAPDPVVLRPGGRPTFLFACAVDDAEMKITHVIRGEDHLPNAWKQEQIQRALGREPPQWLHLPLVLGPDGAPLSKRHGSTAIGDLRDRGVPWEAVVMALAHLGWTPPRVEPGRDPWPELAARFRPERLSRSQPVYDEGRLLHLSGRWLRALPPEELARRSAELAGFRDRFGGSVPPWWGELLAVCVLSRATLGEAAALAWEILEAEPRRADGGGEILDAWLRHWPESGLPGAEDFKRLSARVAEEAGAAGRALFHPLRLALTGREAGPALAVLAPLLDRAAQDPPRGRRVRSCRERIAAALGAR